MFKKCPVLKPFMVFNITVKQLEAIVKWSFGLGLIKKKKVKIEVTFLQNQNKKKSRRR